MGRRESQSSDPSIVPDTEGPKASKVVPSRRLSWPIIGAGVLLLILLTVAATILISRKSESVGTNTSRPEPRSTSQRNSSSVGSPRIAGVFDGDRYQLGAEITINAEGVSEGATVQLLVDGVIVDESSATGGLRWVADRAGNHVLTVRVLSGTVRISSDPVNITVAGAQEVPGTSIPTVKLAQSGGTLLDTIRSRGFLICGVSGARPGFSESQPDGSTTGFDVDFCRAVATAITGNAENVSFVALTPSQRFTSLAAGDVGVLFRNTTSTQSRDTDLGGDFGPTTFHDGQQFMGSLGDGFTRFSGVADIDGATVCASFDRVNAQDLRREANREGHNFGGVVLREQSNFDEAISSFSSGDCDVVAADGTELTIHRARQGRSDQDWVIFPAIPISKEPLAPMYRQNDSLFADVVNWTVFATILAEEKGVTSANIDDVLTQGLNPELGRLFGTGSDEIQTKMGLDERAFYRVVKQIGNYGEIFDRNLAPIGFVRDGSPNALWIHGGLMYSPPVR